MVRGPAPALSPEFFPLALPGGAGGIMVIQPFVAQTAPRCLLHGAFVHPFPRLHPLDGGI